MKTPKIKIITYSAMLMFAVYITGSCEKCDEGNNFEDMETTFAIDSLAIEN